MQRLSRASLDARFAPTQQHRAITRYTYDRDRVTAGIVHFGVGNFHRCHQAVYADKLLHRGQLDWGIVGVSLRSSNVRDRLAPQDYLYTELTLSEQTDINVIGALLHILVAPEDPEAVIEQVADPDIKLVTVTITEKGYCLNAGELDLDHPDLVRERKSLAQPRTLYGYLAAAILRRRQICVEQSCRAPLTVICCDNIHTGGQRIRAGVIALLEQHDPDALRWVEEQVRFVSSMVDRVSPTTTDALVQRVSTSLGLADEWPVAAEPFSQWVIEDNFAGFRPPFDTVGAQFSQEVVLYEQMKLRFLNAAHSAIAVIGYLDQQPTVHEALQQPGTEQFVQDLLIDNLLQVTRVPAGENALRYIASVMQRFHNSALPYQVQQINTDCSQKIQQRWFPSIDDALTVPHNTERLSLILAIWVVYVEQALTAQALNDPAAERFRVVPVEADRCAAFLDIAGAAQFDFSTNPAFMAEVKAHYNRLLEAPVQSLLNQLTE